MSAVSAHPLPRGDPAAGAGVTVRPPRVLIANSRCGQLRDEPVTAERVRQLCAADALDRPAVPSAVVYRVRAGEHSQTGVVVEVSLDDYRGARIRPHECTELDRERQLAESAERTGHEHLPVTLIHPAMGRLRSVLAAVSAERPDVHLPGSSDVDHVVWISQDADVVAAIHSELDTVERLYIADGHHRMAAARHYSDRWSQRADSDPAAFTLGALFPSTEMRILGYPRCVRRPSGVSTTDLLAAFAERPAVAHIDECAPAEATPSPGVVGIYLDGRWYRMSLRMPRNPVNVRASLDVVTLDEAVIAPVLGAAATPTPVPGTVDAIARQCAEGDAIGFRVHPPGVQQVMAVADAGQLMPPKSTWFDPKAGAGLFFRRLS